MEPEGKTVWWYFHTYRHLTEVGHAKPLSCPKCDSALTTVANPGNENLPNLWCAFCDNTFSPGLDLLAQVQAVVGEWEL